MGGRRPGAVLRRAAAAAFLVAAGFAAGEVYFSSDVSTVEHAGFFPVMLDGSETSVFALTSSSGAARPLDRVMFRLTGRHPLSSWVHEGAGSLRPVEPGSSPRMHVSAESARSAAGGVLGPAAPLLVVYSSDPALEGLRVVEVDGYRASLARWQDAMDSMLSAACCDAVDPSALRVGLRFEDGSSVEVRAAGALVARQSEQGSVGFLWSPMPLLDVRPVVPERGPLLAPAGTEGPSAGLAFALAHVDAYLEGGLSNGRLLAASGVVGDSGWVGPVGGLPAKWYAARAAGADVLLLGAGSDPVPYSAGMRVVQVSSVAEAVHVLCGGARLADVTVAEVCGRAEAAHLGSVRLSGRS